MPNLVNTSFITLRAAQLIAASSCRIDPFLPLFRVCHHSWVSGPINVTLYSEHGTLTNIVTRMRKLGEYIAYT